MMKLKIHSIELTYMIIQIPLHPIFHDMMHKNMEDYVDDTLAKSK